MEKRLVPPVYPSSPAPGRHCLSVAMDLPVLDVSCEWNHTICGLCIWLISHSLILWVNSGSWWWTGRPGVLWFVGLQRVGHDWATELNWTEFFFQFLSCCSLSLVLYCFSRLASILSSFPGGSDNKESTCQAGDLGSICGSRRFAWRRKWLPIPMFSPGEFCRQRRLGGLSPWGHKESGSTKWLDTHSSPWCEYIMLFFSPFISSQNLVSGTSLVVQWLRLHGPNAGAWVRSLVRELDPACQTESLRAAAERSHVLQQRSRIPLRRKPGADTQNRIEWNKK